MPTKSTIDTTFHKTGALPHQASQLVSLLWFMLRISIVIFIVEYAVMVVFNFLPPIPDHLEPIIDATLLTLASAPIIYFWMIRPLASRLDGTISSLEKMRDEAFRASEAKGQFLANMSHEIRTPLNGMLGFTDLLQRRADEGRPDLRDEWLETVNRSGRHLLSLINDILDLSKVESGQLDLEIEPVETVSAVNEVMSLMRPRAAEKGIDLNVRWMGALPQTILTDPLRLRQIMLNIVGNGIKFTPAGSVTVNVSCDQKSPSPRLVVEVTDTGIGISPQQAKRLFQPFVQADASVTRKFGGTGLGLVISKRVAQGLGGDIVVRSNMGQGSTFEISVETGSLDGVPFLKGLTSEAIRSRTSDQPPQDEVKLEGRVLVVDDGDTNRKLISLVLRRAGLEVETADNGQAAMEVASLAKFDLILMDMQMPIMDGYSATRHLRDNGLTIPIIALTAHAMRGDQQKCESAGCTGYLTKPINHDELLATVAAHLSQAVGASA